MTTMSQEEVCRYRKDRSCAKRSKEVCTSVPKTECELVGYTECTTSKDPKSLRDDKVRVMVHTCYL